MLKRIILNQREETSLSRRVVRLYSTQSDFFFLEKAIIGIKPNSWKFRLHMNLVVVSPPFQKKNKQTYNLSRIYCHKLRATESLSIHLRFEGPLCVRHVARPWELITLYDITPPLRCLQWRGADGQVNKACVKWWNLCRVLGTSNLPGDPEKASQRF